ncbi:hypothetical protein PCC79_16170 [Propioniciclava soli]|uniref:Uncharacterized protein n=1 Tax=Propioniciclava soli TaxID=2775081 RepID=A0ABZ3C9G1_9ACTN
MKLDADWLGEHVADGRLPLWIRVSLASWYRLDAKGFASFGAFGLDGLTASNWTSGEGELQVDLDTGELLPPSKLTRAVRTAVTNGWIGPGSSVHRAFVPHSVVSVGNVRNAPWRRVHRPFLEAQLSNPSVPGWVRVSLASWAYMSPRGYAPFGAGELSDLTGVSNVRRALAEAIAAGWVGDGSTPTRVNGMPSGIWVGQAT